MPLDVDVGQRPQGLRRTRAGRATGDGTVEPLAELVGPVENEVVLDGEVVVDGLVGHLRRLGDLGDGHRVVPAGGEQQRRSVGDVLTGLRLLALPQPGFSRHGITVGRLTWKSQIFV